MTPSKSILGVVVVVCAVLSWVPQAVLGATQPQGDEDASREAGAGVGVIELPHQPLPQHQETAELESITVTARRRQENLQEVPISVSAFTDESLAARNIDRPHGLASVTPGMVYTSGTGYGFPYLRGIGSNAFIPTVDSSVSTFLDGVYNPSAISSLKNFADIERVEVMRGPQGTLFGRNTTGGAITITTREPQEHHDAYLRAHQGSLARRGASGFVTGPLAEGLAYSLSGYMERVDTQYRNILPDGPQPRENQAWGLRLKAGWQLGPALHIKLTGFAERQIGSFDAIWENVRPALATRAAGGESVEGDHQFNNNRDGYAGFRHRSLAVELNWARPHWTLRSISAYQHTTGRGFGDLDGTNADMAIARTDDSALFRNFSQEWQLSSTAGERLDWMAVGYFFRGRAGWNPILLEMGPGSASAGLLDRLGQAGIPLAPEGASSPTLFTLHGLVRNTAWAVFAQAGWRFDESLSMDAGLRYSQEERLLLRGSNAVQFAGSPADPVTVPERDFRNLPADWDDLSPSLGLSWQSGAGLLYARYAEGFKSGTWNPLTLVDPVSTVEPEKIRSVELGWKSDLWRRRLRLNAAAFAYDYRDLQVFITSILTNGTIKVENAGRATAHGAELELTLLPLPWLQWSLGASWLDARYREFNGTGYDPDTGLSYEGDFAGNRLMYAPRSTLGTELAASWPLRGAELVAAVNWYRSDGFYFDAQNDFRQPAYSLLGARVGCVFAGGRLALSLTGSNLSNENYENYGILLDFGQIVSDAPGRQLVLRLDWRA